MRCICGELVNLLYNNVFDLPPQRAVISQKQVLFIIAIGRQVYLFADITCAWRQRDTTDDSSCLDRFEASDRRGSWFQFLPSRAQTRASEECREHHAARPVLQHDDIHLQSRQMLRGKLQDRGSRPAKLVRLSQVTWHGRASVYFLLYNIHPLKVSCLLTLFHPAMLKCTLMPPSG